MARREDVKEWTSRHDAIRGAFGIGPEVCVLTRSGADNAISETISRAEIGICYASALCFAAIGAPASENDIAGFELPIRKE